MGNCVGAGVGAGAGADVGADVGICRLRRVVRTALGTSVAANGERGSTYERELLSEYPENELLFVTFAIIAFVSSTNSVGWSTAPAMFCLKCMPRHNSRKVYIYLG